MAGILDFLGKTPSSGILATGQRPAQPNYGLNNLGLFGATLRDLGANLGGDSRGANHIAGFQDQLSSQMSTQAALRSRQDALAKFQNATTLQEKQAAALALWGSGGDTNGLASALNVGKPEIKTYAQDQDLYSIDPGTGQPTLVRKGAYKPTPNAAFNPDGTPNVAFQNYQKGLYRSRAEANADFRAPKANTAAPGAVILPPNPASMYRR